MRSQKYLYVTITGNCLIFVHKVCVCSLIYYLTLRSKDEVTPSSPPLLGQTSSEVTTAFGLVVNSSTTGITPVPTTHQSKAPAVQPKDNQTTKVISSK